MANALVSRIRVAGKSAPAVCACVADCYFWGADVPADVEGVPEDIVVNLSAKYTAATFKAQIVQAVLDSAAKRGLVLVGADVYVPAFENG